MPSHEMVPPRKASQPKYLGVISEKIIREKVMASPNHSNTARYQPLPRMSEEIYGVSEENENSSRNRNEGQSMLHGYNFQGDQNNSVNLAFSALPFSRLFIAASLCLSFATLIMEGWRLDLANHGGLYFYRDGMREFIAPIIAFCSFDIAIHLIIIFYFILKRFCHLEIVSTRSSPTKQPHQLPTMLVAYFLEMFIAVMLLVGLALDLRYTYRIPGRLGAQVCGWIAFALRAASLPIWLTKTQRYPVYIIQSAAEARGDQLESGNGKPQSLRASQEQGKPLI